MGDKSKATKLPFTFGGDTEAFCEECQLPCNLDAMTIDCHRRLFLQGMLNCSYFVYGYCFLIDEPGCVFDNGGRHDTYWLQLLNDYFHNASNREEDEAVLASRAEAVKLIAYTSNSITRRSWRREGVTPRKCFRSSTTPTCPSSGESAARQTDENRSGRIHSHDHLRS